MRHDNEVFLRPVLFIPHSIFRNEVSVCTRFEFARRSGRVESVCVRERECVCV